MNGKPAFVFVDVETTGLDPIHDLLLEVGFVITDEDLNSIGEFSQTIHWNQIRYNRHTKKYEVPFGVNRVVVEMHEKSGLWEDSFESKVSLDTAMYEAEYWLRKHLALIGEPLPLAGSSVWFDKAVLMANTTVAFMDMFHYRIIDISSIKTLTQIWNRPVPQKPASRLMHRVLPDIEDSLNELRYYRGRFFDA